MKIFVNPGHGNTDPGACANGLREVDVALNIGNRIADYLRAVGYDIKLAQIDNYNDAKLLVDREDDFARAIARGVTDFTAKFLLPDTVER